MICGKSNGAGMGRNRSDESSLPIRRRVMNAKYIPLLDSLATVGIAASASNESREQPSTSRSVAPAAPASLTVFAFLPLALWSVENQMEQQSIEIGQTSLLCQFGGAS